MRRDAGKKVRNSLGQFKLALPDESLSPFNSVANVRGAHPQALRPKILVIFPVQKYLVALYPPDHAYSMEMRDVVDKLYLLLSLQYMSDCGGGQTQLPGGFGQSQPHVLYKPQCQM